MKTDTSGTTTDMGPLISGSTKKEVHYDWVGMGVMRHISYTLDHLTLREEGGGPCFGHPIFSTYAKKKKRQNLNLLYNISN